MQPGVSQFRPGPTGLMTGRLIPKEQEAMPEYQPADLVPAKFFLSANLIPFKDRILLDPEVPDAFIKQQWKGTSVTVQQTEGFQNKIQLLSLFSSLTDAILYNSIADQQPLSYRNVFNLQTGDGLTRGQAYTAVEASNSQWDNAPFIHHVYFPAITYSQRDKTYVGAGFALFYSSFEPPAQALGHPPRWQEIQVQEIGVYVRVDLALIGQNLHSIAAVLTSLATTRPRNKSYIYVMDCNKLEFDNNPVEIKGASLGLATAMAVMHGPQVAYTGFLKKFPGSAKFGSSGDIERSNTLGYGSTIGNPAANTDDLIEEVAGVQVKMAWAMSQNLPLVVPHKSSFGTDLTSKINQLAGSKLTISMAQLSYSSTQADMGLPYSALKTPLLLASSVPESVVMGAYAYISYYVYRVENNPLAQAGSYERVIDQGLSALLNRNIASQQRQARNQAAYEADPIGYTQRRITERADKMAETTKKMIDARKKKEDATGSKLSARLKKASRTSGSSGKAKSGGGTRAGVEKVVGFSLKNKGAFGNRKARDPGRSASQAGTGAVGAAPAGVDVAPVPSTVAMPAPSVSVEVPTESLKKSAGKAFTAAEAAEQREKKAKAASSKVRAEAVAEKRKTPASIRSKYVKRVTSDIKDLLRSIYREIYDSFGEARQPNSFTLLSDVSPEEAFSRIQEAIDEYTSMLASWKEDPTSATPDEAKDYLLNRSQLVKIMRADQNRVPNLDITEEIIDKFNGIPGATAWAPGDDA